MSYATDHAAFFKLPPQGPDETDIGFRTRVRDALREQGRVIEAAEAFYGHATHTIARKKTAERMMTT